MNWNEKHTAHTTRMSNSLNHILSIWKSHNDSISRIFLMTALLDWSAGMSYAPLFQPESQACCWFRRTLPPHLFLCFTVWLLHRCQSGSFLHSDWPRVFLWVKLFFWVWNVIVFFHDKAVVIWLKHAVMLFYYFPNFKMSYSNRMSAVMSYPERKSPIWEEENYFLY